MRKLICLLLSIIILCSLPVTSLASEPLVTDDADLLSRAEEALLEAKARELSDTYNMDVVIVTVWSLNGLSSDRYAENYYTEHSYGTGSRYNGILFLLSMEYRDWAMITCGDANYVLTDYGIESIFSDISWYLSEDAYYEAFDAWLDELPAYFDAYESGDPIDGYIGSYDGPGYYEPIDGDHHIYYSESAGFGDYVKAFLIALVIGLITAMVILLIMRSKMNTAKPQRSAASYMQHNTYNLHTHQDIFLYSHVHKVRRADDSSGGGRGGGSTVRSGGGGRSFGGGRGKF